MNTRWLAALAALLLIAAPARAAAPGAIEAVDLGPAFRGAHARVLGLDGAFSLALPGGRSLWIFGDTLVGTWAPNGDRNIEAMPNNTSAVVRNADWPTGFARASFRGGATPAQAVKPLSPGLAIWPMDLAWAQERPWMYFVEIKPFGTGPLDFDVVDTGVAMGPPPFERRVKLWPGEAPSFGASALAHDGQLYLYAGGAKTHLARVAPDRLAEAAAYRYWDGRGWSADWREAAALPGSGPEVSVRYNPYLKAFVMFYVAPFGKTVLARFAPAPEGPWSEPTHVIDCEPAEAPGVMFYGAKQHAELDAEGGRTVVLTYNTNGPAATLEHRPDVYWPRLVRVTFRR